MRFVVMLCIALSIAGCGDNSQQPIPVATTKQTKSAAELLAAFKTEINTCSSAVLTFEKDRAFLEQFMDASRRESQPLEEFLRQASFSKSEDIQYIIANRKYFVIDVTFHPTEFAVAWVKNEPVYCGVSEQRLQEIEVFGESPEAWKIRSYFLDKWLKDLRPPSDEADFFPEQYEAFNKFVSVASKLYSTNLRPQFQAWAKSAITHFESQRSQLEEGAGGQTLAEQNEILDKEVAALTVFLQPTGAGSIGSAQSQAVSAPVAASATVGASTVAKGS